MSSLVEVCATTSGNLCETGCACHRAAATIPESSVLFVRAPRAPTLPWRAGASHLKKSAGRMGLFETSSLHRPKARSRSDSGSFPVQFGGLVPIESCLAAASNSRSAQVPDRTPEFPNAIALPWRGRHRRPSAAVLALRTPMRSIGYAPKRSEGGRGGVNTEKSFAPRSHPTPPREGNRRARLRTSRIPMEDCRRSRCRTPRDSAPSTPPSRR